MAKASRAQSQAFTRQTILRGAPSIVNWPRICKATLLVQVKIQYMTDISYPQAVGAVLRSTVVEKAIMADLGEGHAEVQ